MTTSPSPSEALAAQTARGLQLLDRSDRTRADVQEGAALVFAAADAGHTPACRLGAVLLALGVVAPPDWAAGLDLLARAAELDDAGARRQLHLLASLTAGSAAGGGWSGLRRQVDIAAWRVPPSSVVRVQSPPLRTVEGFAPPLVCDWIRSCAHALLAPSRVYDPVTGEPIKVQARSNSAVQFKLGQLDLVLLAVRERIGAAVRLPVAVMEPMQVLRYEEGQAFAPHFDFLDVTALGHADDAQQRGQRLATFLLYLNEDFTGGETAFPDLGVSHRGRKGDALFWANLDVRRQVDRRTLHAGLPPTSGEKWVLSQWCRERVQL